MEAATSKNPDPERHPRKQIHFTVDGIHLAVSDPVSTPNTILALAKIDPTTHYLKRITGRKSESFKDQGETVIKVHEGDVFISVSVGPTPVS